MEIRNKVKELFKLISVQAIASTAAIVGLIGIYMFGYDRGKDSNEKILQEEKSKFSEEKKELLRTQVFLKNRILSDSLNQQNWLHQYVTNVYFLPYAADSNYVHINNSTNNPCSKGMQNGCWKTTEYARVGDIIAIAIYVHNGGKAPINDVSAGFHVERVSEYPVNRIGISGGISIRGKVFISENVEVFCDEQAKIVPIESWIMYNDSRKNRRIIPNQLLTFPGFRFEFVKSGLDDAMWISLWFQVKEISD